MKIMHLCQFLGVGGLEKVLFSLIKEQVNLGHQVEVIVYDHDKRWVEKFRKLGIIVHTDFQKANGYDLKLLKYLKKKIATRKPDIMHTHDLNPVLYLGVLKVFNPFIKIIHTTHGMEHLETHPKTKFYEVFLGFICNKIIAVSPSFKTYYQKQFLTNKKKVFLVDNGTDISPFQKIESDFKKKLFQGIGLDINKPTGIYVARVVPLKAQDQLISEYKNLDHQLLIVGPNGNDQYNAKCESLCTDNIKMLGSRDDIQELLQSSDYFISSSIHEGLPIAVLEAGAQNIPCLLSNIPGHTSFNAESQCVLIFNKISDLSKKVEEILQQDNLAQNFNELIHKKYSSMAMAQHYLNIYQDSIC